MDLISRLSELRCQYNCFDESDRDAYHTLSEAIKARSDVPDTNVADCSDCIKHGGDWDCDHVHCHKGKWIVDDVATEHCSVCKHRFYISALFAVGGNDEPLCCPNCGARMEE